MGPFSGSILYGMNFHAPYIVAGVLTIIGFIIALDLFKYKIDALDPDGDTVAETIGS